MSQKTKITYDEVFVFIKSKGCLLKTDSYKNMKQKLEIQCSCGNLYVTTLDSFKFKNRTTCKICANKKISDGVKLDISYVKTYIENQGCKLVSTEYIGAREKLDIECNCGNIFKRTFNKFKSGQTKCNDCVGRRDWTHENVKNHIEVESNSRCKLITNSYFNRKQTLEISCECGQTFTTDFHAFLNSNKRKCDNCSKLVFKEKIKKGIGYIRDYINTNSNSFLISSTYNNYHERLEFLCECGNHFKTSFVSFMNGKRQCNVCSPSSKLEYITETFLIRNEINYQSQYSFDDLVSKKCRKLKFDFAILDSKNKLKFLIELDGEQHFKSYIGFGGQEKFEQTKLHDSLKDDYCTKNKIILYRISYKELNNLENALSALFNEQDNPVPSL